MQKSDQINELAVALAKVQAAVPPAIKDKANPAFKGTKYADLGAIWDACRALLSVNGLSVVQMPAPAEAGYAALETILLHTSGQYISNYAHVRLARDDAQGAGSAYTYLRRYSLAAFIGIVADEDDDGNAASQRLAQPRAAELQPATQNGTSTLATDAQIKKIHAMRRDLGWVDDVFLPWVAENGINLKTLSKADASWLIEQMTAALNEAQPVAVQA